MATLVTNASITNPALSSTAAIGRSYATPVVQRAALRRKMSQEQGRAIEMLGHAIEYLGDEHALECMEHKGQPARGADPRIQAIQILKSLNREIYLSCPVQPTLGHRFRSLLGLAIV